MSDQLSEIATGMTTRVRAFIGRFRIPLLVIGFAIFIVGGSYSVRQLQLSSSEIDWLNLAALAFVFGPLGLIYGAANLALTARTAGTRIPLRRAFRVNCFAQLAEILPLPGGAIVRGAALVTAGTSPARSATVILANSLLWIACAAFGAGIGLMEAFPGSIWLIMSSAVMIIVLVYALNSISGFFISLMNLSMRILGLIISAIRLICAFSVVSLSLEFSESFVFAFALIAGSASSLAPAGLGVGEGIAALLATQTTVSSTAAFVGVGLDRLIGFAVVSAICGFLIVADSALGDQS